MGLPGGGITITRARLAQFWVCALAHALSGTQVQVQVRREHLAELQGLAGPRGVWVNVEANFALGVRPAAPA